MKNKDESHGKWVECIVYCVTIMVRATYGFIECENHCPSNKHCQKVKGKQITENMSKLTSHFDITSVNNNKKTSLALKHHLKKMKKMVFHVQDLIVGKIQNCYNCTTNTLKNNAYNDSILIHYENGIICLGVPARLCRENCSLPKGDC